MRIEIPATPTAAADLTGAVGGCGGVVTAFDVVESVADRMTVDLTTNAGSAEHAAAIGDAVGRLPGVTVGKVSDRTFLIHLGGKIEVTPKVSLRHRDDLSRAYTPGVARVCLDIAAHPENARRLTGVDAWPVCLDTTDTEEIIRTVKLIAPVCGGINLQDISAPRCFEIERRLRDELDIPVFHDDQHGTAICLLAALRNALAVVERLRRHHRPVGPPHPDQQRPRLPRSVPGSARRGIDRGDRCDAPRRGRRPGRRRRPRAAVRDLRHPQRVRPARGSGGSVGHWPAVDDDTPGGPRPCPLIL
jgi:hypothetical protein